MPYENDDDDAQVRYYPAKTAISHITGQGALLPSLQSDLKSTIAPMELRASLKNEEGLNDQQIDLLLRFEMLRQDAAMKGKLREVSTIVLYRAEKNKEARESKPPQKESDESPIEYVDDKAADLSKAYPKGVPLTTLDKSAYKDTSIQKVVFMLERANMINVLDDFREPPKKQSLYKKLKDAEAQEESKAAFSMYAEELERLPQEVRTTKLAPFATRLSALARAQDFVAVPENMSLSEDGKALLVNLSSYAQGKMEIALSDLQLLASETGSSFTSSIRELKTEEERRFKPMQARIEGDALKDTVFLDKIHCMIQNLNRELVTGRSDISSDYKRW